MSDADQVRIIKGLVLLALFLGVWHETGLATAFAWMVIYVEVTK